MDRSSDTDTLKVWSLKTTPVFKKMRFTEEWNKSSIHIMVMMVLQIRRDSQSYNNEVSS